MRARRHGDIRRAAQALAMHGFRIMIPIHESAGGISLAVKVHPRARRNAVTGILGDALKLSLTAPPTEGNANQACIEFLAKF